MPARVMVFAKIDRGNEDAFEAAFAEEEFQERVEELGSYPNFMDSEDYQSHIDELDSSMEQLADQMQEF